MKAEHLIYLADQSYLAADKNHYLVNKARYSIKQIKNLFDTKEQLFKQLIEQSKVLMSYPY